jgi:hypothetical protein
MLRLALVFCLWIGSTAHSVEEPDAELQETVELEWLQAGAERKAVLERADRDWYHYRRLTDTNVRTILPGDGCADENRDERGTYARGDPGRGAQARQ